MNKNTTKRFDLAFRISFLFIYVITLLIPLQAIGAAPVPIQQPELTLQLPAAPGPEPAAGGSVIVNSNEFTSTQSAMDIAQKLKLQAYTTPTAYPIYTAQNGLSIEAITAYNLIVDSNVLAPSSYGPSAATIGAKFCNTNASDSLTNVWAYTGNYDTNYDGTLGDATVGSYPRRFYDGVTTYYDSAAFDTAYGSGTNILVGATATDFGATTTPFALELETGTTTAVADGSRYIGTLAAGECKTQYWLISYPRKALVGGSWKDVTGDVKPDDDLWLPYFFWGTSTLSGTTLTSHRWNVVTMRNEISAMANKIWPNGDNKVPDQYVAAIQQVLGWDTWTPTDPSGASVAYPGETVTSQGIWYDLGNVGAGFDNNGDFTPDRNIWLQPIGDAGSYDPGCFRLMRTYGLVIVKLNDGTEMLIPFVNQTYFENIPDGNTGAVGLVFYEYIALDGACTAGLTPYQEVASGYDNEKFNGDFGAGIPPLQSQETDMTLDKSGETSVAAGGTINYTMAFSLPDPQPASNPNTVTITVGNPAAGNPLVFEETIPANTTYSAGTAVWDTIANPNTSLNVDLTGTILFSHDSGSTWSTSEGTASTVTHIQWRVEGPGTDPVKTQDNSSLIGGVKFSATVAGSPTANTIINTACLKIGNADPFLCDPHTTVVTGTSAIQGTVWKDDAVTSGVLGNAVQDGAEAGIGTGTPVTVWLYWDNNGDGDYTDTTDFLYATTTSDSSGNYCFDATPGNGTCTTGSGGLPATSGSALYIIVVDTADGDIPTGYGPTTPTSYKNIALAASTLYGDATDGSEPSDFGFAPALSLIKNMGTNGTVYVGGDSITYTIAVTNNLPGSGTSSATCSYYVWPSVVYTDSSGTPPGGNAANGRFQLTNNMLGHPDEVLAYSNMADNTDKVGLSGYNSGNLGGNITSVQYVVHVSEKIDLSASDRLFVNTWYNDTQEESVEYFGNGNWQIDDVDQTAGTIFTGSTGTKYVITGTLDAGKITNRTSPNNVWRWTDFTANLIELQLEANKGSNNGEVNIDTAGFIITTDGTCGGSTSTLNPVPLTDTFDDAYFDFISSDPPVSSSGTGTLTWSNVGPLYAGQTRIITVYMNAAQVGTTPETINTATSTDSKFASGLPANTPVTDTAEVTITTNPNTRSLTGRVFDDNNTNGWQTALWTSGGSENGYDSGDTGIQYIPVDLYGCALVGTTTMVTTEGTNKTCAEQGGEWRFLRTTSTNSNGDYTFSTLATGYYRVKVHSAVISGSQTADVNQNGTCSTCDSQSNGELDFLSATTFIGDLEADSALTRVSFGYNVPSGPYDIGDLLFYDWDGDGVQDAEDEPMSGITVRLLAADGSLITTDTTGSDGIYGFDNYIPAFYTVQVLGSSLPTGLVQSYDPDSTLDGQNTFSLTADNLTKDFAYKPTGTGTIGDTVFKDINGNGLQGGTEPGISGVTVELQTDLNGDGTWITVSTKVTSSSGSYLFTGLPAGSYRVKIDLDNSPYANSTAIPNDLFGNDYVPSNNITSTAGQVYKAVTLATSTSSDLNADFGFAPPASIGDTVYWDVDGDGTQDFADPGIPGVTVTLYAFTDLGNGGAVKVWNSGEPYIDEDGDNAYDVGEPFFDTDGRYQPGETLSAAVTSTKTAYKVIDGKMDVNGDGIISVTDDGSVEGCTVTDGVLSVCSSYLGYTVISGYIDADRDGTGAGDAGDDIARGFYIFTGLAPDEYVVVATPPSGSTLTGDPSADGVSCNTITEQVRLVTSGSDADDKGTICDSSDGMYLYNGTNYTGADFGYQQGGAIGDTLWVDTDNDGVRDATEVGIDNVTVYLCDSADTLPCNSGNANYTTVTDANGEYSFTGLGANTYYVAVDTTDTDLTSLGVTQSFEKNNGGAGDNDAAVDNTAKLVMDASGVVTSINDTACTSCNLTIDFGYRFLGSTTLSGTICLDTTTDGVCGDNTADVSGVLSGTETAYNNATVFLYKWNKEIAQGGDGDGVIDPGETYLVGTTATNSSGDYSFANVTDGIYYIIAIGAPADGLDLTSTQTTVNTVGDAATTAYVETTALDGDTTSAYQVVNAAGDTNIQDRDFAFKLNGSFDFGDLPDTYATTLTGTPDGARHLVPSTPTLYLGAAGATQASLIETNGQPSVGATDDGADEDGVSVPSGAAENTDLWADGVATFQFDVVGSGWLVAWVDRNNDGEFADSNEMIISQAVSAGQDQNIDITNAPTTTDGTYAFRFRLFPSQPAIPSLSYSGAATGGEVEDYKFTVSGGTPTPVTLSYFDAKRKGNAVSFDWSTATETGNIGFNLYVEENGRRIQVNAEIIPSHVIDSLERQDYFYSLNTAGDVFYIEDINVLGETRLHGPFQLGRKYGAQLEAEDINQAAIQLEHKEKFIAQQNNLKQNMQVPAVVLQSPIPQSSANPQSQAGSAGSTNTPNLQLTTTLNLKVRKTGIYRVTYEMLKSAGLDLLGVPTTKLTLTNLGQMVPIFVQGQSNPRASAKFGPGGYIEFYGQALDTTYTDTNIYTVQVSKSAAIRIPGNSATPARGLTAPASFTDTMVVNNQLAYANSTPGVDAWYDTVMFTTKTSKSWSFPFQINGLANPSAPANLELVVFAQTDLAQNPDHHIVVGVNGVPIADQTFDGVKERVMKLTLPAGTLHEGENTLQITLPGDTGASLDVIYLDKFSVSYQRLFKAQDGQLTFTATGKVFKVTNLPSQDVVVYRMDSKGIVRLSPVQTQKTGGTYSVSFAGVNRAATYLVSTAKTLYAPTMEATRLIVKLNRPAKYLIIAHPDFITGLQPLVQARQAQGLTVSIVDVNDLYAQFSYGIFDPQAIKKYIAYAAKNLGTEYVLLVGGDTYDYRNFTGKNSISFIPSLYATTGEIAKFVPVDPLYADLNSDNVPDLAIGRFPVRTTAELTLMVNKTLAYAAKNYGRTSVFASDKYDSIGISFKQISNSFVTGLPANWTSTSIHLDDLSIGAARAQLISAMNKGTALVTFTGHSGPIDWTFSNLFNTKDAAALTNIGRPFVVVQWGCWNTYYVNPSKTYLVQSFLFSGNQGAAAVFGASTLTDSESEELLGELLMPRLTIPGMPMGKALQEAKKELAKTHPELLDVLLGWSLMGDPALVIEP